MQVLGKVVYTVCSSVPPEWDEEFNRFQREEHVPRLLALPGYLATQGFGRLDQPHAFMNVWQIESRSVFDGEARTTAAYTPWRARIAAIRTAHALGIYAPVAADGVAAGHVPESPPPFLVRYDLELNAHASASDVASAIDNKVKRLATDAATLYVRVLNALDTAHRYLVLHYLSERRDPASVHASCFERVQAAPFKSIDR